MNTHLLRITHVCAGLATAMILLCGDASQAVGQAADRDYFTVPKIAYTRSLGEIIPAPCSPEASQVCQGAAPGMFDAVKGGYPMDVSGLGIPLGGIGAGSFMVNQSGTFGPWNFGGSQDDRWKSVSFRRPPFMYESNMELMRRRSGLLPPRGLRQSGQLGL